MTQATIELQVPAELYERAEQLAKESNRSVEAVLLEGLSLVFGLKNPPEPEEILNYNDEELWAIVYQRLAWPQETRLRELLALGKAGSLENHEKNELEKLIGYVDHFTLLRSQALLLLKQRGHDVEARLNLGR